MFQSPVNLVQFQFLPPGSSRYLGSTQRAQYPSIKEYSFNRHVKPRMIQGIQYSLTEGYWALWAACGGVM